MLGGPDPAESLAEGRFEEATVDLKELASRCENGSRGREAVLVWATVELDPRNDRGSAETAARLAARYLQFPGLEPTQVSAGEALYLLALDRGAPRVRAPLDFPGVAPRFGRCGGSNPEPALLRELPEHPGTPTWLALRNTRRALLSARARADSLEAELERIRKVLGQGSSPDGGRE